MTIDEWLREAQQTLRANGIDSAWIDAILMLEYSLNIDRAFILANPERKLTSENVAKLNNVFSRRLRHEPIAYIRGFCEFYGYNFLVNSHVLIPRPESENFINALKTLYANKVNIKLSPKKHSHSNVSWSIADIGTGCGALGITAKLELPNLSVDLIDIDRKALKIAKSNVDKFTLNVNLKQSDLLINLSKLYTVLLCNLPYIPDDLTINKAAEFEPTLALYGGQDGLDIYRKLFKQLSQSTIKPLYILTESLQFQHASLAQIAAQFDYYLTDTLGLVQVFKHH